MSSTANDAAPSSINAKSQFERAGDALANAESLWKAIDSATASSSAASTRSRFCIRRHTNVPESLSFQGTSLLQGGDPIFKVTETKIFMNL